MTRKRSRRRLRSTHTQAMRWLPQCRHLGSPEPPPARPRTPRIDKDRAALDNLLEGDAFEVDSDQLRKTSEDKLSNLKEALEKKKRSGKLGSEPGAILATQAAAVAESAKRKTKSGDKALNIQKKHYWERYQGSG